MSLLRTVVWLLILACVILFWAAVGIALAHGGSIPRWEQICLRKKTIVQTESVRSSISGHMLTVAVQKPYCDLWQPVCVLQDNHVASSLCGRNPRR